MWGSSGHWVHSISGPGDNHALNGITQGFTDFFFFCKGSSRKYLRFGSHMHLS